MLPYIDLSFVWHVILDQQYVTAQENNLLIRLSSVSFFLINTIHYPLLDKNIKVSGLEITVEFFYHQ